MNSNYTSRFPRTMSGIKFGRLMVLAEAPRQRRKDGTSLRAMNCLCDCGTRKTIRLSSLKEGTTVSCGCFHRENAKRTLTKSVKSHGASRTNLYWVWSGMKARCSNPQNKSYQNYGGRGIRVCQEWIDSFESFASFIGARPAGCSIDRFPNKDGNYEPGNVRWATSTQQARNSRRNHMHTINGETHCLIEWCELLREPWTTVKKRIAAGRDPFARLKAKRQY